MRLLSSLAALALATAAVAAPSKRGLGFYTDKANILLTSANSTVGVSWIYNWSPNPPKTSRKVDFVPMQWGSANIDALEANVAKLGSSAKYLLAINEPDLQGQSNLTPQQVAALWPKVEAVAKKHNLLIGSPATIQRDYTWFDNFLAACKNNKSKSCKFDFVTQHWYGTSLDDFTSMIKLTESKYKKPIWVTEYAMIQSTPAQTLDFLKKSMKFLDKEKAVQRYAWFGLDITNDAFLGSNCGLLTPAGQISALGKAYIKH